VREGVGLFDQSSFAKFLLQGRDAERVLNHVSANDVAVAQDRIVYTQWLNERAGIEADLTVTRLDEDRYLVVTAAATQTRDFYWLRDHIPAGAHAVLTDVTSGYAVLGHHGPALARAAPAVDGRRSLERRIPVRDIAGNRARVCTRARVTYHVRGRARVGDLCSGGVRAWRLRHDCRGGRQASDSRTRAITR
jgi:glycine cleavage system aminomethyltransferase T